MCTNNERFIYNKTGQMIRIPCKYFCMECRNMRREEYTERLLHELQTSGYIGTFLTLTYRDNDLVKLLPENSAIAGLWFKGRKPQNDSTLSRKDISKFCDKLSKRIHRKYKHGIKYIVVGEYGDEEHRPHY